MKKKVCVVTGSRAEYGLLRPLLSAIKKEKSLSLQLLVTGTHLRGEFGLTYRQIIKDGYPITNKIDILSSSDTEEGICKSIGSGINKFAVVLRKISPDLIVLLGDRFEIFSCAVAAHILRIPIGHIHGGERTEGAVDEALRHAITKMSLLHFTATGEYRRRVMQLGEAPERVFMVGALGVDNIKNAAFLSKRALERKLGFRFLARNILVTFHPVTLEGNVSSLQLNQLLKAIDKFGDIGVIFTIPNADAGNKSLRRFIDDYVRKNRTRAKCFENMGTEKFLSTVRFMDAVVGNSSSGIIEVPSLGKPTVNIGDRQRGRIKAGSVIDCQPHERAITVALKKAFSKDFSDFCNKVTNPYGDGRACEKIMKVIRRFDPKTRNLKKKFYDINFCETNNSTDGKKYPHHTAPRY